MFFKSIEKLKRKRPEKNEVLPSESPQASTLELARQMRRAMTENLDEEHENVIAAMDDICYFASQLQNGDHTFSQDGRNFLFRISYPQIKLYLLHTPQYDTQRPHASAINHVILNSNEEFAFTDAVVEVDLDGLNYSKRGQNHHGFFRTLRMEDADLYGAFALQRSLRMYRSAFQAMVTSSHR